MYVKRRAGLIKMLRANKQRVSLTADIWVASTTGESYMFIRAHFKDESWHLRKLIIGLSTSQSTKVGLYVMFFFSVWMNGK